MAQWLELPRIRRRRKSREKNAEMRWLDDIIIKSETVNEKMLNRFVFVCACVASGWPGVRCWNRWIRKCFNWIGTNSQKQHECVRDSSRTTTPSHYEAPLFVFFISFLCKKNVVWKWASDLFLSFSGQLVKYDSVRWISLKAAAYRIGSNRTQAGGSNWHSNRSAITTESSANVYAILNDYIVQ